MIIIDIDEEEPVAPVAPVAPVGGRALRRVLRVLILCSGTGHDARSFRRLFPGVKVDTLDSRPETNATIVANVLEWDYRAVPKGTYQIVYASPPCTPFSRAKVNASIEEQELGARVAVRCFEICTALATVTWIVENPVNRLALHPAIQVYRQFMRPTTLCMHGTLFMKPTNLWTNAPVGVLPYCSAQTPCAVFESGRHPRTSQAGSSRRADGTVVRGTPARVAQNMPFRLLRHIVSTVALVAGAEGAGADLSPVGADTACVACGGTDDEATMLLCDGCDAPYHLRCLDDPLDSVPVGDWYCEMCAK